MPFNILQFIWPFKEQFPKAIKISSCRDQSNIIFALAISKFSLPLPGNFATHPNFRSQLKNKPKWNKSKLQEATSGKSHKYSFCMNEKIK